METITGIITEYGPIALAVIGGIVVALAAISPLTKTKLDDKLLGVFTKLQGALAWVVARGQTAGTILAVADKKPGVVAKLGSKFTKYAPKK